MKCFEGLDREFYSIIIELSVDNGRPRKAALRPIEDDCLSAAERPFLILIYHENQKAKN